MVPDAIVTGFDEDVLVPILMTFSVSLASELNLVCGLRGVLINIYGNEVIDEENKKFSICFRDSNYEEKEGEALELLGDEYFELLETIKEIHDIGMLAGIIKGHKYLSEARVDLYKQHKALWEETARIMGVMTDGFEAASEATSRVVDGYLTVEVADSKYGTAIDDLAVVVEENARGYNERFAAVSALSDKLVELGEKITASEGNILRGVVEYDENNVPVIGIAIGQDIAVSDVVTIDGEEYAVVDRTKFVATYTSKAVKFWTDNKLVAYMANNKLYILEAELINRLVLNNFEQCVVPSHGFIIKYTGD